MDDVTWVTVVKSMGEKKQLSIRTIGDELER
jgi:hypothetical protein